MDFANTFEAKREFPCNSATGGGVARLLSERRIKNCGLLNMSSLSPKTDVNGLAEDRDEAGIDDDVKNASGVFDLRRQRLMRVGTTRPERSTRQI